MAQNAQNCSNQREMQKQPKNFKKCQVGEAASIWPLKASKLEIYARFYLTKLVSKYIHDRIIYKKKWCHFTIHRDFFLRFRSFYICFIFDLVEYKGKYSVVTGSSK